MSATAALRALLDDHEKRYGRGDLWRAANEEMAEVEQWKPKPPTPDPDTFFHILRCSRCGDSQVHSPSPLWRWNGEAWEHKCGDPQSGHYPARNFGPIEEEA